MPQGRSEAVPAAGVIPPRTGELRSARATSHRPTRQLAPLGKRNGWRRKVVARLRRSDAYHRDQGPVVRGLGVEGG